jgi:peptide/nickel transport system substrate-binding protein
VEVVDATTVRFDFTEPSSTFLSSVSNPYAGIISPTAAKASGENFANQPVGSGPFKFDKWEPGIAVTLVKNPDYAWAPEAVQNQGAPFIDTLVFKVLPDASQQVSALQAGEVDALFVNQTSHVAKLKADPSVEVVETTLNSLIYLGFNLKKTPLDDVRVRQALSHAVNKDELVKTALGGVGSEAFAPLAPTLPGFDPALKSEELGFDLEKAKTLLQDVGFAPGSDGMMIKDGQPIKLTLVTSTRPPNQALATVLQSQMKAAGVQVEIQLLDSNAVQEVLGKGEFDMMLWRYDWNDPDVLRTYLTTSRIGRTNRNSYSNEKVDALLEDAAHEMDDTERNALYLEAQKLILQDAPWQPLYTPKDFMVIRKDLTGVVMGPMGRILLNDVKRGE